MQNDLLNEKNDGLQKLIAGLGEAKKYFQAVPNHTNDEELKQFAEHQVKRKEMQISELGRSFHVSVEQSDKGSEDQMEIANSLSDFLTHCLQSQRNLVQMYDQLLENTRFEEVQRFILRHQRQGNLKETMEFESLVTEYV